MIWNACRWSSSCSSYKMSQGEESTLQTRCGAKIMPILLLLIILIIIINVLNIGIKILTHQNISKYRRTERSRVVRLSHSFSSATSLSGWALKTQQCFIVLKISNNSFRTISFKLYHSRLQVIYTFEVQKVEESPVQVRSLHCQLSSCQLVVGHLQFSKGICQLLIGICLLLIGICQLLIGICRLLWKAESKTCWQIIFRLSSSVICPGWSFKSWLSHSASSSGVFQSIFENSHRLEEECIKDPFSIGLLWCYDFPSGSTAL